MSALDKEPFRAHLLERYENLPRGHFISLVLLRTTQSETIFRTEGSGEPLCREATIAGVATDTPVDRIVITKRKQTAVERRTGRELLRDANGFEKECLLNTQAPCEVCPDCLIYGFAVGSGGAQRSRVLTEDAYSLLDATEITDTRTFNALFDNSTMRHPTTNDASTSLGAVEYVRPGAHFLDIETLKDLTAAELTYVLGNILCSSRYGAIGTRAGHVENRLLGVALGRREIFSTLELTRHAYDLIADTRHPLSTDMVAKAGVAAARALLPRVFGWNGQWLDGDALAPLLDEVEAAYTQPARLVTALKACYSRTK
jgi:CRISPR-associated protein Csc2